MNKNEIRSLMRSIRDQLPSLRREQAHKEGFSKILSLVNNKKLILSYASFGSEFDTQALNAQLAQEKRLALPYMEGSHLVPYVVKDCLCCIKNAYGIEEPNPEECVKADPLKIDAVLVPALCFDQARHRLGYGKGFYDELLPRLTNAYKIGIGYREQLREELLPSSPSDHPLDKVILL